MAIKPMLFNTEMVQALLEGRKTVTRRAVKFKAGWNPKFTGYIPDGDVLYGSNNIPAVKAPYKTGDVLWVRETFQVDYLSNIIGSGRVRYKSDGAYQDFSFSPERYEIIRRAQRKPGWRPNENMPREVARIFLRVTDVRAERLQEMSDDKALAEGVPHEWPMSPVYCPRCKGEGMIGALHPSSLGYMDVECPYCERATIRFARLWDSTIKPADRPTYGWETNPWVWVIEFERCEKPEGWPC